MDENGKKKRKDALPSQGKSNGEYKCPPDRRSGQDVTKAEIAQRRLRVSEMMNRHGITSHRQIQAALNKQFEDDATKTREELAAAGQPTDGIRAAWATKRTVRSDIAKANKDWKRAYLGNVQEMKVRELRRLDRIYQEGWAAYDRSRGERTTTTTKTRDVQGEGDKAKTLHENKVTIKDRAPGDVRCLELLSSIVMKAARIEGLLETKIDLNVRQGISIPEMIQHIESGHSARVITGEGVRAIVDKLAEERRAGTLIEGTVIEDGHENNGEQES